MHNIQIQVHKIIFKNNKTKPNKLHLISLGLKTQSNQICDQHTDLLHANCDVYWNCIKSQSFGAIRTFRPKLCVQKTLLCC